MKKVNQEMERLCKQRKVPFLHTYRMFFIQKHAYSISVCYQGQWSLPEL